MQKAGEVEQIETEADIDAIRERIAIEVEHLPPSEAQAEYDRRVAERGEQ